MSKSLPLASSSARRSSSCTAFDSAASDVSMKALNEVELKGEDAQKMHRLIDALEDLDDVSNVYTSAVFDDEE